MIIDRETEGSRTVCTSSTLFTTTNTTMTAMGSNSGLRGEKPATNRLWHYTALYYLRAVRETDNNPFRPTCSPRWVSYIIVAH
jgi:hypothetical protein